MDATAILDRLSELGIFVRSEGGKVLLQPASKVPSELKDALREHKAEILTLLTHLHQDAEALLARPRTGHSWLLKQHKLWQSSDTDAAKDAAFSKAWAGWWELDRWLRADGF